MAVVLIVEDGSGLPNSNAYVSVEGLREWADARGIELPESGDDVARFIIRATDYIETFECEFCGKRLVDTQALAFPRDPGGMPKQLVGMTAAMANAYQQGFDPQGVTSNADMVTEETVGPITTKYADPFAFGEHGNGLSIPAFDALLAQVKKCGECGSGAMFRVVRA